MVYKILLNTRNATLTNDFFKHTDEVFECMSTSEYWEDIFMHFKVFQPDAYVFSCDVINNEILSQLKAIKREDVCAKTPVIFIGDGEICEQFEKQVPKLIDLSIRRPITIKGMVQGITDFFVELERKRKEEEKAKKEAEEKAAEELAKQKAAESIQAGIDPSKKHVLIVDDDRSILKLLKAALESTYNVTVMVSGKMAEKYLETKTADLILLDYEMPLETGPEVLKKIKQNEKAKDIPVIFLTGVADPSKVQEVIALEPQGYLLKPINIERLFSAIHKVIG